MGGGSSNAATVFHCLKNLYNLKIKKKKILMNYYLAWVLMFHFVITEKVQWLKEKEKKFFS